MPHVITSRKTVLSAVIGVLGSVLIKYHESGELNQTDLAAAGLAVASAVITMVPLDQRKIVEEFNHVVSGYIQGNSILTPKLLAELLSCSTSTRPYYIVDNESDNLLWINSYAAKEQDIPGDLQLGDKKTNMVSYHYPEVLDNIKRKLIIKDEFLSCHKAFQLLSRKEINVETYFRRVELEDGAILRVSTGYS